MRKHKFILSLLLVITASAVHAPRVFASDQLLGCFDYPTIYGGCYMYSDHRSITYDSADNYSGNYPDTSHQNYHDSIGGVSSQFGYLPEYTSNYWRRFANSSTGEVWYIQFVVSGGVLDTSGFGGGTNTRFDTVEPYDGETVATSTVFNVGVTGYVASGDYVDGMVVQQTYLRVTGGGYGTGIGDPVIVNHPVLGSGYFSYTATSSLNIVGQWELQTIMTVPDFSLFGINFGSHILQFYPGSMSTTTFFIVGQKTASDYLFDAQRQANIDLASTTANLTESCSPSLNFKLADCLAVLFVPNMTQFALLIDTLKTGVGSAVPWGYVTRFLTIVTQTASSSLPVLTIPIPAISAGSIDYTHQSATLTLDTFDNLMGTTSMFGTATSTVTGKTFRQIVEPGWTLLVVLLFAFMVIHEVMGINAKAKKEIT